MTELTNSSSGITILGLGPGNPELLTRQAWDILLNAKEIYLRTEQHPLVPELPAGLIIHSFDDLYAAGDNFDQVYTEIVQQIIRMGKRPEGVVYAVPGNPFVAEATTPAIIQKAREEGIAVRTIAGLSFIEPALAAIDVDPFPQLALVDALDLSTKHVPLFPPHMPALIAQIYSRQVASDVKLTLTAVYPDEHPVKLVHAAGTQNEKVEDCRLFEIDRSTSIGVLSCLYLPPLDDRSSFEAFQEVVAHLRAPEGCPWDKEQTHQSLRPFLLEETYEVLSALDDNDPIEVCEELGDLLLQIYLHAQIASEEGEFAIADVLRGVHTKIVSRHPHVFGDVKIDDSQGVLRNWERLKAIERTDNGKSEAGLLSSVAMALPALSQAQEIQRRAARVGFDWKDIQGVWKKVEEELSEIHRASNPDELAHEIGDLLFTVVNLARWQQIDSESTLRETNARFRRRFSKIEAAARERGCSVADLSMEEMDSLWEAAKS
jgi:tetrapyrrole methylase family protein/MazG family protein